MAFKQKVFSNLQPKGQGRGIIIEVKHILPLGPFYYIAGVCNNMKNSLFEVKKKQVQSE